MPKRVLLILLLSTLLLSTGCTGSGSDEVSPIEKASVIGTWQTESDMESVTLVLNEDNTFSFEGTGFGTDEEGEVTLIETGEYSIDGNVLTLNIQDVTSSGLEHEEMESQNLGELFFYLEMSDDNTQLNMTEKSGSIAYSFKRVEV